MRSTDTEITVAVAGLGAAGLPVARWLDRGVPGLRLTAVAASSPDRARTLTQDFEVAPLAVPLADLPRHADVIVEALPPARFRDVADPAIEAGRTLIILSLTQLLAHMQLIDRARETGARIIAASGAIAGLDAVRAAAMGGAGRAVLQTRKPQASLANAPFVREAGLDLAGLSEPLCLFSGNVAEAAQKFPANVNVAVAVALAGWGAEQTRYEIWADPGITRNTHKIMIESDAVRLEIAVANVPSEENPATGRMTPLSVMATLQRLTAVSIIGS